MSRRYRKAKSESKRLGKIKMKILVSISILCFISFITIPLGTHLLSLYKISFVFA